MTTPITARCRYDGERVDAVDYLGVIGSNYEPVQNEASCELLDALVDESGAHCETALGLEWCAA
jgi:hypothetical protein